MEKGCKDTAVSQQELNALNAGYRRIMPRILPRLLERMGYFKDELWTPLVLPRATPKSLYKPVPPRPSFHPAHHPHSILLAPVETNPITSSRVYNRHKTLPPRTRLSRRIKPPPGQYDAPREMSKDELQWWSNPYRRYFHLSDPIHPTCSSQNAGISNPEVRRNWPLFTLW